MLRSIRFLVLLLLTITVVLTTGCDAIEDTVNDAIPEVDVPVGSAGNNIPVAPGSAAQSTTVDGEEDLPSGFDVTNIILDEEQITYTPLNTGTAAKTSRVASGTIFVAILLDRVPAVSTTLTITDDAVTDISPSSISIGEYDATALAEALEELDDADDLLRDNYENLSGDAIRDIVSEALVSDSFELSVLINTSDDLLGTLDIEQITVDIEV